MKKLIAALILATGFALPGTTLALAADCGLPPGDAPRVPDGTTATSEQIRIAIQQVQDYGTAVQRYLNCMQLKRDEFFLNMSTEQRERWSEDYNALADLLEATEVALNEQIRIYNRR